MTGEKQTSDNGRPDDILRREATFSDKFWFDRKPYGVVTTMGIVDDVSYRSRQGTPSGAFARDVSEKRNITSEQESLHFLVSIEFCFAALNFALLPRISAPYGPHFRPGWGASVNYLIARHLSEFGRYPPGWLCDPRFVLGTALFVWGQDSIVIQPPSFEDSGGAARMSIKSQRGALSPDFLPQLPRENRPTVWGCASKLVSGWPPLRD